MRGLGNQPLRSIRHNPVIESAGLLPAAVACSIFALMFSNVVEAKELKTSSTGEEKQLDEFGFLGSPERIIGNLRKTLFVPRTGSPAHGEPNCGHSTTRCKSTCFSVQSVPTRYVAKLDGRWTAYNNNPQVEWFNTDFGGAWARLRETDWTPLREGRYRVCFEAKNWNHDWDRSFEIQIEF